MEDIAETEALLHQETETIAESEAETPEERSPVSSEIQETEASLSAVEEDIVDLTELAEPEPALQAVHDASWTRPKPSAHDWKAEILPQLRNAEPKLSVWLGICLEGLGENAVAGEALWERIRFLLVSLGAPADESDRFVEDFARWAERMEYEALADFRSELQYRLAIALDLEDEEDERSRLFLKLQEGLSRTREHLGRSLTALFAGHDSLSESFWEELEEVFIMGDMGVETSMELVKRLKARAGKAHMASPEDLRPALAEELREIFRASRKVVAVNPPEVVLVIGVNGVGKTTTIAKLAYRARMQGKKVLLAAADTFRAAAVEQLRIWADRTGSGFHSKGQDADPAAVAWEAMDIAVKEGYDVVFVDTAGRLHTKDNLMAELSKIRNVLGRKCPGAPHRSVLVVDATTGQNALQQTKIFKEAAGVDEIILTKLDGTAKGGIAVAIALRFGLTISFVGLGEKVEDLRPFDGDDFSRALLGLDA
ncbi:MAG: signal recognition particle-docking protein FtsY [Desulfovibrionaceae bacterium]|nr:signal recognition particle-docking protein FtsY [Desulfovibrionaceae bacterium]